MEYAFGLPIPRTLEEACDPAHTALLVYDMQVGIMKQIKEGERVTQRVADVLAAARDGNVRTYYTRHMSLPNRVSGIAQLKTAREWQHVDRVADTRPAFPPGSPQFQIIPDVAPREDDEGVIDKITMSAFVGTPLDILLRSCRIETLVIVGVAMEVGIEPTARHATDLGYLPVIVTDACGAGNAAAAERSLAALDFAGGSFQTDTATITRLLNPPPP